MLMFLMIVPLSCICAVIDASHLGVYFHHRGQLVYVSSFHQTVVEVKLNPFLRELSLVEQEAHRLYLAIKERKDTKASTYLKPILSQITEIRRRTLDIQTTERILDENAFTSSFDSKNNKSRKPRGLVNGIGTAASYLFGLATEEEIEDANRKVGIIKKTQKKVITEVNKQITVLHELSKQMSAIKGATRELQDMLQAMNAAMAFHERIDHILWLQGTLNRLSNQLNTIDLGLQKMRMGKIAPEIISIEALNNLLKRLQTNGRHLLFERAEQLALYADLSLVVPVPAGEKNALRFVILLPMKDMAYNFHLFEISPIPIWNSSIEIGVVYEPNHRYLAVSEDLMIFSPISSLEDCKNNGENFLCPAGQPIFLRKHSICGIALYTSGTTLIDICPRRVYTSKSPAFTRTSEGYMYSIPSPMKLNIQCSGHPPVVNTTTIHGMGTIKLNGGCHATGDGILLVSPKNKDEHEKMFEVTPMAGINGSMLNEQEFAVLEENKLIISHEISKESGRAMQITRLLSNLQEIKDEMNDRTWQKYSRPGSILAGIVSLIIILVTLRILWKMKIALLNFICFPFRSRSVRIVSPEESHELTTRPTEIITDTTDEARPRIRCTRAGARRN